jgi:DNA-binding PadR family transcriptional regulator
MERKHIYPMRTHLTLNDLEMFVLGFIMDEAVHGYHLTRNLKAHAELFFEVGESMVYNILRKLEKHKLISGSEEKEGNYPSRRKYSITRAGKRVLLSTIEASSFSGQLTISHMINFISSRRHFKPERFSRLVNNKITRLTTVKKSFRNAVSGKPYDVTSEFLKGSIENELKTLRQLKYETGK